MYVRMFIHGMYMYVPSKFSTYCIEYSISHLYMVHVCSNGVKYGLQITYIEGSSSLFACVMIHDICTTFHVHGDW